MSSICLWADRRTAEALSSSERKVRIDESNVSRIVGGDARTVEVASSSDGKLRMVELNMSPGGL